MAAPELVIADAPYKKYPGGVIALRASDWLGPARGTLSTEADARSACGTVVRDTQKVTTSIFSNPNGAFQEADDTLVIDFAALPIEIDMTYNVFVSLLIEGDWDITNDNTTRGATQEEFSAACDLRWYGDSAFFLSDTDTAQCSIKYRGLDSYRIGSFFTTVAISDVEGDEILYWRAYAQNGTTIEYLIDQIYFVPYVISGTKADEWRFQDFNIISGQQGTFSGVYDLSTGGWIDGADGGNGDDLGKFTWHPYTSFTPASWTDPGGGDYQKDDAEYMARVVADGDFYYLENSETDAEALAHGYGCHGPWYVPEQIWIDDPFSRTVGDGNFAGTLGHFAGGNWGDTPEGFGWSGELAAGPADSGVGRVGRAIWVDGSQGRIHIKREFQSDLGTVWCRLIPLAATFNNLGARIISDNIRVTGKMVYDVSVTASGGSPSIWVDLATGPNITGYENRIRVRFDLINLTWEVFHLLTSIAGPFDISSWFGISVEAGWRIEILRYQVRVRVWDASGAEPSTWDVDEFRPLRQFAGTTKTYPYQTAGVDDLEWSIMEVDNHSFDINPGIVDVTTIDGLKLWFDDISVYEDPIGTNESVFANIERPEGSEIAQIEIPAGCQHIVYWGTRDWTEVPPADDPALDFSAKMWNNPSAAELQRSEAVWWWFRSVHGFGPIDLSKIRFRAFETGDI